MTARRGVGRALSRADGDARAATASARAPTRDARAAIASARAPTRTAGGDCTGSPADGDAWAAIAPLAARPQPSSTCHSKFRRTPRAGFVTKGAPLRVGPDARCASSAAIGAPPIGRAARARRRGRRAARRALAALSGGAVAVAHLADTGVRPRSIRAATRRARPRPPPLVAPRARAPARRGAARRRGSGSTANAGGATALSSPRQGHLAVLHALARAADVRARARATPCCIAARAHDAVVGALSPTLRGSTPRAGRGHAAVHRRAQPRSRRARAARARRRRRPAARHGRGRCHRRRTARCVRARSRRRAPAWTRPSATARAARHRGAARTQAVARTLVLAAPDVSASVSRRIGPSRSRACAAATRCRIPGAVRSAGSHRAYVREPRAPALSCARAARPRALDPRPARAPRARVCEVLFGLGPGRLPLPVAAPFVARWAG